MTNFFGYYTNPLQDLDYLVLETVVSNTLVGKYVEFLNEFVMGKDFAPKLELINSTGDEDKDLKLLKEGEHIITTLKEIDNHIDNNGDITLRDAVMQSVFNMFTFNRSALFYGYDEKIC